MSKLLLYLSIALSLQAQSKAKLYSLHDTSDLDPQKVKAEAVEYKGRKAVRITKEGVFDDGFALIKGTDFQDGTIEVDLAAKITGTPPPGLRMPGFLGVAFRARNDGSRYELLYVRPGNARSPDQAIRNHALQYTSEPDFGWHELRTQWPWVYEGHADLQLEEWIHVKIEVAGRTAKLYVNGEAQPGLVVDGLKGQDLHGAVALWSYPKEDAYFSNLRVTPAPAQAVKNGGEAAGSWELKATTDQSPLKGTLKLTREGGALKGMWSPAPGEEHPVTGTWRDGYVEFSFPASWIVDQSGKPKNEVFNFAGWIDGNAAKGRIRVPLSADGQWSATRQQP